MKNNAASLVLPLGLAALIALPLPAAKAQSNSPASSGAVAPALLVSAFPPGPRPRPGHDQFIDRPVDSTDDLVAVLKKNATLRKNFAEHFGIAETRVVEFVRDALVPAYLLADRQVTNYGINRNGKIYGKRVTLKKGTRVWATRSGNPILKWSCANPLTVTMPGTTLRGRPKPVASRPPTIARVRDLDLIPDMIDTASAPIQVAIATPNVPEIPFIPPDTPIPGIAEAPEVSGEAIHSAGRVGVGMPISLLGKAGLFVPLVAVASSVRSHTSTSSSAVPEPATVSLVAMGAVGLLALRRRRR